MTYESLDQMVFVTLSYVLGVGGTIAMVGWSWIAMRRAERRRDKVKRK